jgi:plastocyanin
MAPEDRRDAHEGGYGPHMKTVGWSILVMGVSIAAVIFAYLWIGHIGPSYSSSVMAKQQADLRKQYGLPSQQTPAGQLEVPPSLRNIEGAGNATSGSTQSASTNTTGGSNETAAANQTAGNTTASNQTAGNATAGNQTGSAASSGATKVSIVQGAATKTTGAFDPSPVKVKAGGTVTWANDDSMPHTATSGKDGKPDGTFDSSTLAQGKSFSFMFEKAGEYPYYCMIHPTMVGTVSVS